MLVEVGDFFLLSQFYTTKTGTSATAPVSRLLAFTHT